ncbi:unnamed protein product [Lota lota]
MPSIAEAQQWRLSSLAAPVLFLRCARSQRLRSREHRLSQVTWPGSQDIPPDPSGDLAREPGHSTRPVR